MRLALQGVSFLSDRLIQTAEGWDVMSGTGISVVRSTVADLPAAVPIEDLAPAGRQFDAPCVALALVGATASGAQVYVDLESVGSLTVVGRVAAAEHVVCAIAAALVDSSAMMGGWLRS